MSTDTDSPCPMSTKPQAEHEWLNKFVGEWTFEGECQMGPDQPPMTFSGTESARLLGGLWVQAEAKGTMPGGGVSTSLFAVTFDPAKGAYVGTFVASVSAFLWVYEGQVDETGTKLILNTTGPDMSGSGGTASYRDITEFTPDGLRILTSEVQGADGGWTQLVRMTFTRKA